MSAAPFVLFGAGHLVALAATAAVAAGLSQLVRRRPGAGDAVRYGLAAVLLAGVAAFLVAEWRRGTLTPWDFLPLHLCDFLIFVAAFALATRRPFACELLFFWACAGALLAMVTPDVAYGFPDRGFVIFFGFHGAVLTAAVLLTFGLGIRPAPGAPWRVFLLTNAYAAVAGLVNLALGTNFLYLRHKPAARTLLDGLGPWPYYLMAADALALGLFMLLGLPFCAPRSHPRA